MSANRINKPPQKHLVYLESWQHDECTIMLPPTVNTKPTPEDAFYENLTLGLQRTLHETPRITKVAMVKRQPCERTQVATWEQRHNVYLPDDMKRFYLSTDGFTMHWSYQYSRKP